jgi:DNA-binding transcriptional ArsR family regulator
MDGLRGGLRLDANISNGYCLRMNANTLEPKFDGIRQELGRSECVEACARRYGNMGDATSMKMCYLLRHYPDLSVSQLAELAGVSISAASRCLKKLSHSEVLESRKDAQTVYYRLSDNEFTRTLLNQLAP